MNHPEVSIIVPVYNVEKYLGGCLDSLLKQTYSDFEIILVNDGSTDSSGKICEEYADSHPDRIRVINRVNGGLSAARNTGIDNATGAYFVFVDSDDTCDAGFLENMVSVIKESDADMVVSNFEKSDTGYVKVYDNPDDLMEEVLNQTAPFVPSAWGNIYRANLFADGKNRFVPRLIYEDLELYPRLVGCCRKIIHLDRKFYNYLEKRPGSILNKKNAVRTDVLKITDDICGRFRNNPRLYRAACNRRFAANFNVFLLSDDVGIRKSCWAVIKELRSDVLMNRKARLKNRIGASLSYFGAGICRLLFSLLNERH